MSKSIACMSAAALALLLVAHAGVAEARPGAGQRAQAARPQHGGGSWTRTTERQKTDNGHTRRDTWTGENGKTATRDATVVNDREAGTRTKNVDWTGPNGGTRSKDVVTTRTDDGFTRNATVTNAKGETATREMTVVNDREAGTHSVSIDRTGFDGKTSSVDSVRQRTDDGFTKETTVTHKNGDVTTRSVDLSCDKDAKSCVKTVEVDRGN